MKKKSNLVVMLIDYAIWLLITISLTVIYLIFSNVNLSIKLGLGILILMLLRFTYSLFDISGKVVINYFGIEDTIPMFISESILLFASIIVFSLLRLENYIPVISISHMLTLIFRIAWRAYYRTYKIKRNNFQTGDTNVLIYGAGSSGAMIAHEIISNVSYDWNICGFIDDNIDKVGTVIHGIKVLGTGDDLNHIVKALKVEEVIVAMPRCKKTTRQTVIKKSMSAGVKVKNTLSSEALFSADSLNKNVVDVEVSDLLGRQEIVINDKNIKGLINGRNILVTGGGGSIGSELARQIIKYSPRNLVLLDISENGLYDIQMEILRGQMDGEISEEIELIALVASIRDKARLDSIFDQYNFDVVFHAAAHKHVPLMEKSPQEAIKNNIMGTLNLIEVTNQHNVKQFINISTDKAVNPTNIMGATKRFIEMMLQSQLNVSQTNYCAVRFGNVLGSNGSVIPLFKKQIADGGPVTVTHKDIIRYFMTIPEAVSLVLQAGTYAKGGEIFVLDMGKPVKILTLAEQLIELSGYVPYKEIDIKITGLRPGEKLFEELLLEDEGLKVTENNLIFIATPSMYDFDTLKKQVKELDTVINSISDQDLIEMIHKIVPSFKHMPNE